MTTYPARLGPHDPEPPTGSVVKAKAINGEWQEIWESSSENIGGWCTTARGSRFLGNGYLNWTALHAHYASRGAVIVLMSDVDETSFKQGWYAGRQDLLSDITGYVHDLAAEGPHDLATLPNNPNG
jgi:hypothetical protein